MQAAPQSAAHFHTSLLLNHAAEAHPENKPIATITETILNNLRITYPTVARKHCRSWQGASQWLRRVGGPAP